MAPTLRPDFALTVPDGDNRERAVCAQCGFIDYRNPKIVVGSVVSHDGRILLCRRAIEPRRGFWTLPAGYLELGETAEAGARREAREEAEADIAIDGILGLYSIERIGQCQIIYRADFADPAAPHFAAGPESEAVALFAWEDIPWDELAFPSVHWALAAWRRTQGRPLGAPDGTPATGSAGQPVAEAVCGL